MTSKLHNLLLWLITAILLAIAGPALAATDARLQGAAEQVYDAVTHEYDAVDSMRHGHRRDAEGATDDLYDAVTHFSAGVEARAEPGWLNVPRGKLNIPTAGRSPFRWGWSSAFWSFRSVKLR